jgi:hypothetical protein
MLRALAIVAVAAGVAAAEPVASSTKPTSEPELAGAVTHAAPAPRPDQASGVARDDAAPVADRLLWLPRAALFVPRMAVWAVGQPVRGAAYAYEKYNLPGRFRETFFSVDGTFGIYPVARYETGFGFTGGTRLVHTDLFGASERLKLRADVGGRYRQAYGASLRSGERLGPIAVELDASYERRPQERFYGIGDAGGVATRFREDLVRTVIAVEAPRASPLRARLSGALMVRDFAGTGEADSLENHHDTMTLVGWDDGVENVYVEAELAYDSRRPTSPYGSRVLDATGWLASMHAGVTRGIGDDRSELVAYGGEVQRYIDLYDGSRVLVLRVLAEAVAGDVVPFIDLPRLGGSEYLRGYPSGRFRDRAIALGTAEYTWDLGNYLAAYAFVDAGRAWSSLADVGVTDLRVGYGGGVQVHSSTSFLTRVQIAASADGDVFFELALTPAYGRRERAGRY